MVLVTIPDLPVGAALTGIELFETSNAGVSQSNTTAEIVTLGDIWTAAQDASGFSIINLDDLTLTGNINFPDDVRQTFNPGNANPGLNVGSKADPDPTTPTAGDMYFNTTSNEFRSYDGTSWAILGAQTPWESNIDAASFNLTDFGSIQSAGAVDSSQVINLGNAQRIAWDNLAGTDVIEIFANVADDIDFRINGVTEYGMSSIAFGMVGNAIQNVSDIQDENTNEQLIFVTVGASAVNEFTLTNALTTLGPTLEVTGDDTDIDFNISAKGTGTIVFSPSLSTSTAIGSSAALNLANTEQISWDNFAGTDTIDLYTNASDRLQIDIDGTIEYELSADALRVHGNFLENVSYIADSTANEQLIFSTVGAAINEITITNAIISTPPIIAATGDDTDIDLSIIAKGTGTVAFTASAVRAGINVGTQADPDPTTAVAGDIYLNTTSNLFKGYDGTGWVNIGSQTPWLQNIDAAEFNLSNLGLLTLRVDDTAAILTLDAGSTTPATGTIGDIIWQDVDTIPSTQEFARIRVSSDNVTSGAEEATMTFRLVTGGSISNYLLLNTSGFPGEIVALQNLNMFGKGIIFGADLSPAISGTEYYIAQEFGTLWLNAPTGSQHDFAINNTSLATVKIQSTVNTLDLKNTTQILGALNVQFGNSATVPSSFLRYIQYGTTPGLLINAASGDTIHLNLDAGAGADYSFDTTRANFLIPDATSILELEANHTTPAAAQVIGRTDFIDDNSVGTRTIYSRIQTDIFDPTNGSEDGELFLSAIRQGSLIQYVSFNEDGLNVTKFSRNVNMNGFDFNNVFEITFDGTTNNILGSSGMTFGVGSGEVITLNFDSFTVAVTFDETEASFDNINIVAVNDFSLAGNINFPDNIRQTFNPGATVAGINVGVVATTDPSTPTNGDLWYNTADAVLRTRIGGVTIELGSAAQTPWVSDIDAATFDLTGLSNLEFSNTTGAPGATIQAIWVDADFMNFNIPTGDTFFWSINGVEVLRIDSSIIENSVAGTAVLKLADTDTSPATGTELAEIQFFGDTTGPEKAYAEITAVVRDNVDVSTSGELQFKVIDNAIITEYISINDANTGVTSFSQPIEMNATFDANSNNLTNLGRTLMVNRFEYLQGIDVASAGIITLGDDGNVFSITGTTTINEILATNWQQGSMIHLQFDAVLTVTNNSGGTNDILLGDGANMTTAVGDVLTLFLNDAGDWQEVSRSAASLELQTPWLSDIDAAGFNLDDLLGIRDSLGLEIVTFATVAIAVNEITITNAVSAAGPIIETTGTASNIDLNLTTKGIGRVTLNNDLELSQNDIVNCATLDLDLANTGTTFASTEPLIFYTATGSFLTIHTPTSGNIKFQVGAATVYTFSASDFDMLTNTISNAGYLNFDTTGVAFPGAAEPYVAFDATNMGLNVPTGDTFLYTINATTEFEMTADDLDFNDNGALNVGVLNLGTADILTIATGAVTATKSYHTIAAETGTADNLATISGGTEGDIIILRADAGDTITIDETGNIINSSGGTTFSLTGDGRSMFIYDGTNWISLVEATN